MKSKLLDSTGQKTFALVFDKGDEVIAALTLFAKTERVGAAHFTAIGAFSELTLGYFDPARKDYKRMLFHEQVEVLSLIGDIALDSADAPKVHAHAVVGGADGAARGGHLLAARVWPTLEVILVESPSFLRKRYDPDSGLALIDLAA
jgi:predicted DNA-binding protein with PD1-like motif